MNRPPARSLRLTVPLTLAAIVLAYASLIGSAAAASTITPGSKLWAKRYDGPASGSDGASSVAVGPDGTRVFVTGASWGGPVNGDDYATLAYDSSTGAKLWSARYNGPADGSDVARSVAVSPDGTRVFVTGSSVGSMSYNDYATLAYDSSTGAKLWAKRYDGPASDFDNAYSLAVSPDGTKVYVTGSSGDLTTGSDYATIAYDASTGARLWAKRYDGPASGFDDAYSLAVSPDGTKVFVTGSSWGGSVNGGDFATVAYDATTGAELWAKRYNGPASGYDYAYALAVSPDGTRVFVTGRSYGSASGNDYTTLAYDSTGAKLWAKRYDGPSSNDDRAYALAVSPDGTKVFVTGGSYGSTGYEDYATVAYDASTGARLWAKRYGGPANFHDDAVSVAVSPDGTEVFVTGGIYGSTGYQDYATLAYDAPTGAKLWAKLYDGPGNGSDDARSVAVSPDGTKVFVTGGSYGSTSSADYATLAYAA